MTEPPGAPEPTTVTDPFIEGIIPDVETPQQHGATAHVNVSGPVYRELYGDLLPGEIPDLSHLDGRQLANLLLNLTFGHQPPAMAGRISRYWLINSLRLIDKVIHEYTAGREAATNFTRTFQENPALLTYFDAVSHFETCINALVRCYAHCAQNQITGGAPEDLKKLRHALEHGEERIFRSDYVDGSSIMLTPGPESLSLLNTEMSYGRLASLITTIYQAILVIAKPAN